MRSERYQIALISLGVVASLLFAYFLYKELFPEYRIYQDDYIALEEFRSTYTGEPPPAFKPGVKQIVFEREDKGPAKIDRCTSCHVAMQLPHFSPTKIEHDVNGNIVRSDDGTPVLVPNENDVWFRLDQKIAELRDEKVNEQLIQAGEKAKVAAKEREAARLEALKTKEVDGHIVDMTKVLAMHPLIGKETRPFEFHPVEEYGCTSCHSGNGRGLTTEKAHGPVFDGTYEAEYMGPKPEFTERDVANDPQFASVFNHKPGDSLLFQTTPILVGNLIQASCVQCHLQSSRALMGLADTAASLTSLKAKKTDAIKKGFMDEEEALVSLLKIKSLIEAKGIKQAEAILRTLKDDPAALPKDREKAVQQLAYIATYAGMAEGQKKLIIAIDDGIDAMVGSKALSAKLKAEFQKSSQDTAAIDKFLAAQQNAPDATGTLFAKRKILDLEQALLSHIEDTQNSLSNTVTDDSVVAGMESDIDWLTKDFRRGQELFFSQACYACHRIAGQARGGVGPELTNAGSTYPWFLKESIVWPQADLRTSTMPNFVLDHLEVEDLMTFLLSQKGPTNVTSQIEYKLAVQEWEAGRKTALEKPVPPSKIHDVRYGMTVFATQGCAACHRLQGFESNVGFSVEKDKKASYIDLLNEKQWFASLFPEEIRGSNITAAIESHADEIDKRIVDGVRSGAILEEIEKKFPETIESFYSDFRFASRAKDAFYEKAVKEAKSPAQAMEAENALKQWKERVHRVLMMYVQEYGLGRLIGPRPNWSGIYRSDEWLMEHFHNPASHVPRSIMPVMPFDDTKFYALTYMLDVLGRKNRDSVRAIWQHTGFQPEQAYNIYCSQCHGDYLLGNGPVATWIYPIPKNLRNAEFLRNLTRENVIGSITHGVKGTPMPPWGETPSPKPDYDGAPVLTADEVEKLVDWLYSSLPGSTVIRGSEDVPKWQYEPEDVIKELEREGNRLIPAEEKAKKNEPPLSLNSRAKKEYHLSSTPYGSSVTEKSSTFYAALKPVVSKGKEAAAEEIFDSVPNPVPGGDKTLYYIKKKYYTPANIESGREFFELNCAACHGREADGTGMRAGIMVDAKPRMLNNLDWIKSRDDLRLLRSIKYGVAGTAMTPWGDLTSSLQRLQLVIFIRTLSEEKEKRDALAEALYSAFEPDASLIEGMRIKEYPAIDALQSEYDAARKERSALDLIKEGDGKIIGTALDLYKKQLEVEEKLNKKLAGDQLLLNLKQLIGKQKELFLRIGNDMIAADIDSALWDQLIQIINVHSSRFSMAGGKLTIADGTAASSKLANLSKEMGSSIDKQIASLQQELTGSEGKFPSAGRDEEISKVNAKIALLTKFKGKLLSGLKEDSLLAEEERKVLAQINQPDSVRTNGQNQP